MSTQKCVKLKKNVRWLRDINPKAFSWWAGRMDLKIYSLLVFQEVAQLMNYGWIKIQSWT